MGFDARWGVVSAADVGAPHRRDRIWIVAHSTQLQRNGLNDNARVCVGGESFSESRNSSGEKNMAYACSQRRQLNEHVGNIDGREICRSACQQGEDGRKQSLDNALFSGLERQNDHQESPRRVQQESGQRCNQIPNDARSPGFWATEPDVGRMVDGVAARVDRLKAIGNGQVSLVAATAWSLLK